MEIESTIYEKDIDELLACHGQKLVDAVCHAMSHGDLRDAIQFAVGESSPLTLHLASMLTDRAGIAPRRAAQELRREVVWYYLTDRTLRFDIEGQGDDLRQVAVEIDGDWFTFTPDDPSRFVERLEPVDRAWERENDRRPDVC